MSIDRDTSLSEGMSIDRDTSLSEGTSINKNSSAIKDVSTDGDTSPNEGIAVDRAPPKQREPFNNIRRKDNVSPRDFVDKNVSLPSHNTNEVHVAILKRKVNALRSRTWRLRQAHATQQKNNKKGEISPKSDAVETATDMDKLRSTLSLYLSPAVLEFVLTQVQVSKLSVKDRRWTHSDKSLAFLYFMHRARHID
ncbi:hypothetical protein PoB_001538900 [Plakobranchus ocellatus]|uniref:Uncharacterized protein n=1 Tax=Plakobranchus ocellatus TaxID=259542 RepID=A0AAV3Z4E0_9GAST|nr:hypothetical protein PoB_001538900 [Plakobranchus ocellatus]